MPWNKATKTFAYFGGAGWLLFVWIGMLNYTPMDMSGGSVVQAPHIQLRPNSTQIAGAISKIHIAPNQQVQKGQTIYEIDSEPYEINVKKALSEFENAQVSYELAEKDIRLLEKTQLSKQSEVATIEHQVTSAKEDLGFKQRTYQRFLDQNQALPNTVSEGELDRQRNWVNKADSHLAELQSRLQQKQTDVEQAKMDVDKARMTLRKRAAEIETARQKMEQAQWDLQHTRIEAPADGYVTNYIAREGQYVGSAPRIHMYTDEKYVLMRVNHQAIRNIHVGSLGEFATAVYPGKIFKAEVEGIIEATGESQGSLFALDPNIRTLTHKNAANKFHFVRLKIHEPEGYDIPVGSAGLAWISGDKPLSFLSFLDAIRGILIRMKSQIYFFYSI